MPINAHIIIELAACRLMRISKPTKMADNSTATMNVSSRHLLLFMEAHLLRKAHSSLDLFTEIKKASLPE